MSEGMYSQMWRKMTKDMPSTPRFIIIQPAVLTELFGSEEAGMEAIRKIIETTEE